MKMAFIKQQIDKALIIFLLILFFGCSTIKKEVMSDDIYLTIISDYCRNNKSDINHYQYFNIRSYKIKNIDMKLYRISSEYNKVVLSSEGDAYYPKDYIEFKKKTFFIEGEITNKPSEKIYNFLKDRNLIDSAMYKVELGLVEYEDLKPGEGKITYYNSQKVTTYVVCETSNKIIKKWRTNKSETTAKNIEKAIKKGCKN
ncbi:hypothetical protein [Paenimyroides ceti]